MLELGIRVQDKISGFTGAIIARSEYLSGSVLCLVAGQVTPEGKIPEELIDSTRLTPTNSASAE